ncbi:MAG: hypothetical protein LQ352_005869 [Teloschistes flavicans]|nr:MAG: hypothetical protein LQ352_005869 [Teloschistes flavicans]
MNPPSSHNPTSVGLRGESKIDVGGKAWWKAPDNDTWRPAVFHSTIRQALIREAAQKGSYTFPRKPGTWGHTDVTAYHPGQDWGLARDHRPPKTFQFYRTRENEPDYEVPIWIFHGHVVLDVHGQSVLDYQALPTTISSKEDGCFLEGMFREDPRMGWVDFAARMPITHPPMMIETVVTFQAIAMRQWRFRLQAACPSWTQRDASVNMQAQIERLVPRECLAANSTKEFRDLMPIEMRQVKAAGKKRPRNRANQEDSELAAAEAEARNTRRARNEPESELSSAFATPMLGDEELQPGGEDQSSSWLQFFSAADNEELNYAPDYPMQDIEDTEQHHNSQVRRSESSVAATATSPPTHNPRFTNPQTGGSNLPVLPPHRPHSIARDWLTELNNPTPAIDFREVPPTTPSEQATIDAALKFTLNHFLELFHDTTGYHHAPIKFPGLSYKDAYDQYVKIWENAWAMRGTEGKKAPVLTAVGAVGWCNKFPILDGVFKWYDCDEGYLLPPWHESKKKS